MDNHINQVSVGVTMDRTAAKTDFGMMLARGIANGTSQVAGVASAILPGGAVISAAINRTVGQALSGLTATRGGGAGGAYGGTTPSAGSSGSDAAGFAATGSGTGATKSEFDQQLSADAASDREYLRLQHQMQQESQVFNTISNIMKVRHESAKTAINNIR